MKYPILLLLLILSVVASNVLNAAIVDDQPYASVAVGYGGIEAGHNSLLTEGSDNIIFRVGGGYYFPIRENYQFGPELAFEQYPGKSYHLASTGEQILHYQGNSVQLLGSLKAQLTPSFFGIAKLGAAFISQNYSFQTNDYGTLRRRIQHSGYKHKLPLEQPGNHTQTGVLPVTAIGIGYTDNKYLGVNHKINVTFIMSEIWGQQNISEHEIFGDSHRISSVYSILVGLDYVF